MGRQILRYQVSSHQSLQADVVMPGRATVKAVSIQSREIMVWVETVDEKDENITRTFRTLPTGGDIPKVGIYLGTVFDGPYAWHIYEITTP